MKKSVKDDPLCTARNAALNLKNPLGRVHYNDGLITLVDILEIICGYIENCLELGDDPLDHLRHYFSDFIWAFHKPKNAKEVAKIVSDIDYALPESIGCGGDCMNYGMFTVVHRRRKTRKKICFCGRNRLGPDFEPWWGAYKELEKVGARIFFDDAQGYFNPKRNAMIVSPLEVLKLDDVLNKKIDGAGK